MQIPIHAARAVPSAPRSSPRLTLLVLALAAPLLALSGLFAVPAAADAAPTPSPRIAWKGSDWYLTGASVPWLEYRCDFGCRQNGGVVGNAAKVDLLFRQLSRRGVKVVRWNMFPGDAWQVRRSPDGTPTGLRHNSVNPDLDRAVSLAAKHDIYLHFVLFSDLRELPPTWFSDPAQREGLAASLAPLFARHGNNEHVLAWELFDEPEPGIEAGHTTLEAVQATVSRLASQVHASSGTYATIGAQGVDRLPLWLGLGLDFYAPHWWSANSSGPGCAGCVSTAELAAVLNVDRPVVIGATDVADARAASERLSLMRSLGYAGTLLWNVTGRDHPTNTLGAGTRIPLDATWRFIYATPDAGPRKRPLNPCLGPDAGALYCPDLQMSPPASLVAGERRGRPVLFSRNSINSVGAGPAEIFARRDGRFTMTGGQRVWERGGGKLTIDTDAKLLFKAIPGQDHYWKWRDAATFELWRLDGAGNPTHLVRTGPKTVYCLRDLRRTRGALPRSPRRMHYPACSKRLARQQVTLGTSVGWSDIYPATYFENWIEISQLRGCFAFVHIADPTNVIYEANEDNNRAQVTVRLPYSGSNAGCPNARPVENAADSAY